MTDDIQFLILAALATLITLSIHEFAHALAAYKLGDNTAKYAGRLTINPLKHLDPIGAACLLLFHFGWAKPVPINPTNFKNPKRGFAISALAGPLTNLAVAFICAFVYLLLYTKLYVYALGTSFLSNLAYNAIRFFAILHTVNIGLGVFNLIPVPPLDGSRLLTALLPTKIYFKIMKYERRIYLFVIAWLLLGSYVKAFLMSIPLVANNSILSFIAGVFSLSGIISTLISWISGLMLDFWQLFPIFHF